MDEIDWDKVDTDDLETQAILSTPGSSQHANQQTPKAAPTPVPGSASFQDRLRAAVDDGVNKRKREDEVQTPKRARADTDEVSYPGPVVYELNDRTHSFQLQPHLDHPHIQYYHPPSHPSNKSRNISSDKSVYYERIIT